MSSQGPNAPSTGADDSGTGTISWNNPGNVTADDGSAADAGFQNTNVTTHYLKATGYGFSIPAGATINGIVVEIKKQDGFGLPNTTDNIVSLVKGGSVVGSNKADTSTSWASSETYATYGTSSDLWGTTWSVSDVNASNFGAVISAHCTGAGFSNPFVDHIRITVYYTAAATGVGNLLLLGCGA